MTGSTLLVLAILSGPADLPPGVDEAKAALEASPRHAEWVDVSLPGGGASVHSFVVYPERADVAPAVIVIHEIHGLTDWIRGVADQLAAAGFVAIAPDFLSGRGPGGGGSEAFSGPDDVRAAISSLSSEAVTNALNAVRSYVTALPAASGSVATLGFCWGGARSFEYATRQPALDAAVVYYGTSPDDAEVLALVEAPILGLYGGDDARVNATIETARAQLVRRGKTFETHVYDGAGHGFLRALDGRDGANSDAAKKAWPATLRFLRKHTEWMAY